MNRLSDELLQIYKETAFTLTGSDRRAFQAKIAKAYLKGSSTKAERIFGWGRNAVKLGAKELETGYICFVQIHDSGRNKIEEKTPSLEQDIRDIVEPRTHVDPKFKNPFKYTRITAKTTRKVLVDSGKYADNELPSQRTISNILNRMGYTLKRVLKTKPLKKVKENDAIFDNVHEINKMADKDPEILRISIDSKAKVDIGDFSRGGKSRGKEAMKANDHDMNPDGKLVPFGILEVLPGALTVVVGNSAETSDFIADALQMWWDNRKDHYAHIKSIVINLDNGPSLSGHRTQFLNRMGQFAQQNSIDIHLVYYPPYHSKYNPVERCWGVLENHWNGAILNSVDAVLGWIKTMTWKGNAPMVHFLNKAYEKGITLTKQEMKAVNERIRRSTTLPRWDLAVLS